MPDKEGDDEKKSTKSVVNKRQKQMMGEEGYDIARDMGKVSPSKDKKDATTMPVSDEVKKTQKVNKGPSALELVKKKYGKAVMNVGKKKANEELDLSKVAESFGGYIVEANGNKKQKPRPTDPREPYGDDDMGNPSSVQKDNSIDDFIKAKNPFDVPDNKRAKKDAMKQGAGGRTGTRQDRKKSAPKPGTQKLGDTTRGGEVKTTIDPSVIDPKFAKKSPPKKPTADEVKDERKAAQSFKKDLGGEKIVSADFEDELDVKSKQPRSARKRYKNQPSFADVKSKIDAEDAERKSKGSREYSKRLDVAYGKSLEGTKKGQIPSGSPLPQATGRKGEPQKPQPDPEPPVSGVFSGRGVGRVDKVGGSKPVETGRRSSVSKDPELERAAQSGINPRTGQYYDDTPAGKKLRKSDFARSKGVDNVKKNVTQGALERRPSELEAGGGFDTGRSGESITRRPSKSDASPNITVNVNQPKKDMDIKKTAGQIGRKFSDVATDAARSQSQSMMGAMGGVIGKSAFPDVAGAEAGVNLARGDKLGAALSLGQSLGGSLGFAAGVANAIRMRMPNYKAPQPVTPKFDPRSGGKLAKQGQVAMDTATGEREAKMSVGGMALGRVLRNVKNAAKQNARRATSVRGGRAIQVSAGK